MAQQSEGQMHAVAPAVQSIHPSGQRQAIANASPHVRQLKSYQRISSGNVAQLQSASSATGLPSSLQAGIESLSGLSMNDVRVHYNSSQPAQLQAHAFAQGRDIHIAPGQERHLPHEAWHVVQQKQGRVKPTLQLKGKIMVNDDQGLESEADGMGAKAIQMGTLQRYAATPLAFLSSSILSKGDHLDASAVLQGAFIRSAFDTELLVDEDPNANPSRYRVIAYLDDDVLEILAEDKSKQVRVKLNPATKLWEEVPNDDRDGEDFKMGNTSSLPMDLGQSLNMSGSSSNGTSNVVASSTSNSTAAHGTASSSSQEDLLDTKADTKQNMALAPVLESGHEGPKMSTNLVAQISLVPIAAGKVGKTGLLPDRGYSVDQLWVERVQLGNNDRPETRYGSRQERHTVAWTLQRAAQTAQSDRSLREVLTHYAQSMRELFHSPDQTQGCKDLAKEALLAMKGMDTAILPMDIWQFLVSRAAVLYMQAYQQAASSTFKQGKAKGRNEAGHMAVLREAEEALIMKQTIDGDDVVSAAQGLLDVGFYTALGEEGYFHAFRHWVAALESAFPDLMAKHGKLIIASVAGRAISPAVKKRLGLTKDATIGQMITHFANKQKAPDLTKPFASATVAPSASATRRRLVLGGTDAQRIAMPPELESHFMATIRVQPAGQGKSVTIATQISDQSAPTAVEQLTYPASDVEIKFLQVSDMDRPETRFDTQMSHTVAWTLLRAELASFAMGKADNLLTWLADRFLRMGADLGSNQADALLLNQRCLAQALRLLGGGLPIHQWQALLSELVRMYAIIYQRTLSATFADEKTHGRALGHGEASAMKKLTNNEFAILNAKQMPADLDDIVDSLMTLFDGEINKTLSGRALATAAIHWRHALGRVFPNVMVAAKANLDKELAARKLSAEDTKAEGVNNLAALMDKYAKVIAASTAVVDQSARKQLSAPGAAANSRALLAGLGFTHHAMPGTGNNCAIASILHQLSQHGVNLGGLNVAQFAADVRAAARLQDGAQIDLMQSGVALLTHINTRLVALGRLPNPGRGMTIDLYAADNDGGLMPYQNVATIAGANPVVLTLYFNPTLDGGKGHFDSVTGPLAR
ncbi:MAG: DUF4157 domain-containing protein [Bacteroidia bacterium]